MIVHFRCQDTEQFFYGRRIPRFVAIETTAMRKLQQLHSATNLAFLKNPPANHLEILKGDRSGQYSIRINSRWRICFTWKNNHAYHVEIVDYH